MPLFKRNSDGTAERTVVVTDAFTPDSEVIESVLYDEVGQELYVRLHNGTLVGYRGVFPEDFEDFKNAASAGRWWNQEIKGYFTGVNTDGITFTNAAKADIDAGLPDDGQTFEFDEDYAIEATFTVPMPVDLTANKVWEYADSIASFLEENEQEIARRFFESA